MEIAGYTQGNPHPSAQAEKRVFSTINLTVEIRGNLEKLNFPTLTW
jgi:hypothetical protein